MYSYCDCVCVCVCVFVCVWLDHTKLRCVRRVCFALHSPFRSFWFYSGVHTSCVLCVCVWISEYQTEVLSMSLLCASFVPINVWSSFVSLCLSLSLSFLFFFLKLGNKKRSPKKLPYIKLGHDSENGLSAEWQLPPESILAHIMVCCKKSKVDPKRLYRSI